MVRVSEWELWEYISMEGREVEEGAVLNTINTYLATPKSLMTVENQISL